MSRVVQVSSLFNVKGKDCSGQLFIQCQGLFRSVLYTMSRVKIVQVSSLFHVKGKDCSGQLFIQCQG